MTAIQLAEDAPIVAGDGEIVGYWADINASAAREAEMHARFMARCQGVRAWQIRRDTISNGMTQFSINFVGPAAIVRRDLLSRP